MDRKRLNRSGGSVVLMWAASALGAVGFAVVGPLAVAALVGAAEVPFVPTLLAWVHDLLGFLVVPQEGAPGHALLSALFAERGRLALALVGAALPFAVTVWRLAGDRRRRLADFHAQVAGFLAAREQRRTPSVASAAARAFLAERGIAAGPDAAPRQAERPAAFSEVEAEAAAFLRGVGGPSR